MAVSAVGPETLWKRKSVQKGKGEGEGLQSLPRTNYLVGGD